MECFKHSCGQAREQALEKQENFPGQLFALATVGKSSVLPFGWSEQM